MMLIPCKRLDGRPTTIGFDDLGIIEAHYTTRFMIDGEEHLSRMLYDPNLNAIYDPAARRLSIDYANLLSAGIDPSTLDLDNIRETME